jgi:ABC-type amino acid transport substrate-binding protein
MKMRQYLKAALFMISCFAACSVSLPAQAVEQKEPLIVRVRAFRGTANQTDETKEYKYQVLKLILEKTEKTDGPFKIQAPQQEVPQARDFEMVKQGYVDVILTSTSPEREQELHPIRIPFEKGLYGYHIAIINESDQPKFSAVRTLDDLRKLTGGLNAVWPENKVFRANGLKVVATAGYRELFTMLKERRFDYFIRTAAEPWRELRDMNIPGLAVEKDLLIYYPEPGYIFTSKNNLKLADRLERGLRMAIEDGSFDKVFYNNIYMKEALERGNLKNRRVIKLENPWLSPETPLNDKKLWYEYVP